MCLTVMMALASAQPLPLSGIPITGIETPFSTHGVEKLYRVLLSPWLLLFPSWLSPAGFTDPYLSPFFTQYLFCILPFPFFYPHSLLNQLEPGLHSVPVSLGSCHKNATGWLSQQTFIIHHLWNCGLHH